MRNPWFHFQQFSLRQDRAAMKISTDACIFGAWSSVRMGEASHILDIGTGTGLLTLMLAQKKQADNNARFEAIELDIPSLEQAETNFDASPWPGKITLYQGDIRSFSFPELFDFIIVNPPFFEGQLASPDAAINQARHDSTLLLGELPFIIKRLLTATGRFSILLPGERGNYFLTLAVASGFRLAEHCLLKQTPDHEPFRSLMLFVQSDNNARDGGTDYRESTTEVTIRDTSGKETAELLAIMEGYYIR